MPIDDVSRARIVSGRFLNDGGAPPSRATRQRAAWGARVAPLRLLDGPANLFVGTLLATTLAAPRAPRPGGLPVAGSSGTGVPGGGPAVALLPAAGAHSDYRPLTTGHRTAPCTALTGIANSAAAACIASPRLCGTALGVGAATAIAATLYCAARDALGGPVPVDPGRPAFPDAASQERQALREAAQQISVVDAKGEEEPLEAALLRIYRDCDGNRTCRAEGINPLLERLPASDVARLVRILVPAAPVSPRPAQGTWPPMADAAAFDASGDLLALVDALSNLYSPEQAAFQYYLERIVASTVSGGGGREGSPAEIQQRWIDANLRRQETMVELLERDVGPVARLPYTLSGLAHLGIAEGTTGINLHVTLPPAGGQPPVHRVLLVAHGDMIGRSLGSEGALDNGSGLATLLLMGTRFRDNPAPDGTQIELLVTSYEELGFIGARAYVNQCLDRQDCPAFVINIDMTGRGGHGYAMSGTDALAGSLHLGQPTLYLQAPPVTPIEQHARQQLEQRLAAHGFTPAPAQDTPWLTSDNIPFQNASIPCVGISQMSADDARLWKQVEDARKAWNLRDAQVDWTLWQAQRNGTVELSPDKARALKETYRAASDAYHAYRQLRDAHPNALPVMIHSQRDRLHRVNPAMGAALAEALEDGIRNLQWDAQGSRAAPLPPTH
jgi:hypothetical protein